MIDKFRKLVAVAEDMATKYQEMGECVEGMDVKVEDNEGVVRVGVFGVVGVNFSSDDNVHFPEYGIDYKTYDYNWVDGEWVPRVVEVKYVVDVAEIDGEELPF